MTEYFVRTIEIEPTVSIEQSELIDSLDFDNNIKERFPISGNDHERNKLEAYKVGSREDCELFINKLDMKIQDLFIIELLPSNA